MSTVALEAETASTVRPKLPGLEATRSLAAMAIVVFHLIWMSPGLAIPEQLSFMGSYFGFAVPLFYIVSAFGLCVGYAGRLTAAGEISEYLRRRFFRIAPLFYAMIFVYAAYLYLEYGAVPALTVIASSVLFIFNMIPQHVTGYVWASWSIGVEMLFYLLLPVLLIVTTSFRRAAALFAVSIFVTAMWTEVFSTAPSTLQDFGQFFILAHALYFAAGILGYFVWRAIRLRLPLDRQRLVGQLLLLASAAVTLWLMTAGSALTGAYGGPSATKFVWAIAFAAGVVGIALAPIKVLVNRITTTLGRASFSLYLLHPLVIDVLKRRHAFDWFYEVLPDAPAFLLSVALTLVILVPLSLMTYKYIEVPGMRLAVRKRKLALATSASYAVGTG